MKSLIRNQSPSTPAAPEAQATVVDEKVAQCCAKVSKTVAGCHD
jgi:hypothetical protein